MISQILRTYLRAGHFGVPQWATEVYRGLSLRERVGLYCRSHLKAFSFWGFWASSIGALALFFSGLVIVNIFMIPNYALFILFIPEIILIGISEGYVQRCNEEALARGFPNLCKQCGYDMHASGNRCPECGTEMSAKETPG